MMNKSDKIKWFHVLLYRTHMMRNKPDMLAAYGVESSKHLTDDALDELIAYLVDLEGKKKENTAIELRTWRHKVLRMVAACGIDTQDWNKVNAFVCQPRIAGKHLYECKIDELKSLHRKLHNVAEQKAIQAKKEMLKALMN